MSSNIVRELTSIIRCVRRALLLGEGLLDRRQWVEDRIEELAKIFAVGVGGFSVMDNHLHLLVRLDSKVSEDWSDDEVVRRWGVFIHLATNRENRCRFPRTGYRAGSRISAGWRRLASGCKASVGS